MENGKVLNRSTSLKVIEEFLKTQLRFKLQHIRDYFYLNGFEFVEEINYKGEKVNKEVLKSDFRWLILKLKKENKIKRISILNYESLIFQDVILYEE